MFLQSQAIVLKTVDFSESSLVVTLFSRNFGKIRALAKGGRRLKGPFETALDLMSHILVTFIPKRSDTLDLLTESKLLRRFRPTQENFGGLYAGYYLIELLHETTIEQEPMPELFDAAVETLSLLMTGQSVMPVVMRFEWQLLELTGHFPSLDDCVVCGNEIDLTQQRIAFGHIDGGVICPNCRPGTQQVSIVTPELIQEIQQLAVGRRQSAVDREKLEHGSSMRVLLNRHISHLIGKRPEMFDYFKTMVNPQ